MTLLELVLATAILSMAAAAGIASLRAARGVLAERPAHAPDADAERTLERWHAWRARHPGDAIDQDPWRWSDPDGAVWLVRVERSPSPDARPGVIEGAAQAPAIAMELSWAVLTVARETGAGAQITALTRPTLVPAPRDAPPEAESAPKTKPQTKPEIAPEIAP